MTAELTDAITLSGAANRLLTGRAMPTDLATLHAFRHGNHRAFANAARLFIDLWEGATSYDAGVPCDTEPSNVISLTVHQTRHDMAHAFRSPAPSHGYDPNGPELTS